MENNHTLSEKYQIKKKKKKKKEIQQERKKNQTRDSQHERKTRAQVHRQPARVYTSSKSQRAKSDIKIDAGNRCARIALCWARTASHKANNKNH